MKKKITIASLLLAALPSMAQYLPPQASSPAELAIDGWTRSESTGDLNKDGIADLAIVLTPDTEGPAPASARPLLAIYFGQSGGGYRLWRQYPVLLPANDGDTFYESSATITERGTLCISLSLFQSAGGYGSESADFIYRYQDGGFRLIGKESRYLSRNTGEDTTVSENYLTNRRQTIVSNAFDDSITPTEKWERMGKRPPEQLEDLVFP